MSYNNMNKMILWTDWCNRIPANH